MTSTPTAPRGVDRFVSDRAGEWADLADLVTRARGRTDRLPAEDVLRLGDRYRAAAADLARARQRWPGDPVVGELDDLVKGARSLVYRRPGRRGSVLHWLTTGFFQRVRERPRTLLVAIALLWGPSIVFAVWADHDPATATRVAAVSPLSRDAADAASSGGSGGHGLGSVESASLATEIFTNNIRVSLICLAGGLTGGLLTAGLLLFNGMVVGVVVGIFTAAGAGDSVVTYLAPHGILELSLVAVAGAAGLRVGSALVAPGLRPRVDALVSEMRAAAEMALGVALWLVPTGLIEGFVTPTGLPPSVALAVGCAAAGCFWGLVWWRGVGPGPAGSSGR